MTEDSLEVRQNILLAPTFGAEMISSPNISEWTRELLNCENVEQAVRNLPPITLYLAVVGSGINDAAELIQAATSEQYKFLLDFYSWDRDSFKEEEIWRWLEELDDPSNLQPLTRFLHEVDMDLLTLLVARNVESEFFEEPTESPPGQGFFTPDHGFTWVNISNDDATIFRLCGRLLALLFQTKPERFYQLLNEAKARTGIELEEEAFAEKTRRLLDFGLPDLESCVELHTPRAFTSDVSSSQITESPSSIPVAVDVMEPLQSVVLGMDVQQELSWIASAALLHYRTDFSDVTSVSALLSSVNGVINIGLQKACGVNIDVAKQLVAKHGLKPFYRAGLFELNQLKRFVEDRKPSEAKLNEDRELRILIHALTMGIPRVPIFTQIDYQGSDPKFMLQHRAFSGIGEVAQMKRFAENRLLN